MDACVFWGPQDKVGSAGVSIELSSLRNRRRVLPMSRFPCLIQLKRVHGDQGLGLTLAKRVSLFLYIPLRLCCCSWSSHPASVKALALRGVLVLGLALAKNRP